MRDIDEFYDRVSKLLKDVAVRCRLQAIHGGAVYSPAHLAPLAQCVGYEISIEMKPKYGGGTIEVSKTGPAVPDMLTIAQREAVHDAVRQVLDRLTNQGVKLDSMQWFATPYPL